MSKHSTLETLVSKGKTKEAIESLKTLIDSLNEEARIPLIALLGRFTTNKKIENRGTELRSLTELEKNRITNSFLSILSEVKEMVKECIHFYKPIPREEENRPILRDFIGTELKKKFYDIKPFAEGTDFIYFKAKAMYSDLDMMIRVLKSSDSTNITQNKHLNTILKLKHRNLIQIFEINFQSYPYYIITEFIPGINMEDLLSKLGPLPLHNVKRLLGTIGDVMNTLRKKKFPLGGLRPSKIFIDYELEPEISPFSLFIASDKKRLYKTFKEDCLYFSPETLYKIDTERGSEENDKSNQFCLATLGFEMLTGKKLFEGTSLEDILFKRNRFFTDSQFRNELLTHERVPKKMANILKKMLQFNPKKRYDNMSIALRAIARVKADFDKDELQAFRSYRRCLEYRDDFVELFYEKLIAHPDMKPFKPETPEEEEALYQKFYVDLHLLFDVENAISSLGKMATLEEDEHNPLSEYLLFLDTFIETIYECDPRCKLGSATAKSWQSIKDRILIGLTEISAELGTINNANDQKEE